MRRTKTKSTAAVRLGGTWRTSRLRKTRTTRVSWAGVEKLEERAMLSAPTCSESPGQISCSGGIGETTKYLALPGYLNLVDFSWENYTIPDEFQILLGSQRIAGDMDLQRGGKSGRTVVTARSPAGQATFGSLTIKVTAPRGRDGLGFSSECVADRT